MWWLFFCAGKTECSWLLEYVWVEKEQTLIIFPQHSMVLWPCLRLHKRLLAVCNAFNVPDNQAHINIDNYFLSSSFLPPPSLQC